jgi:hypothetical protein
MVGWGVGGCKERKRERERRDGGRREGERERERGTEVSNFKVAFDEGSQVNIYTHTKSERERGRRDWSNLKAALFLVLKKTASLWQFFPLFSCFPSYSGEF